MTKNWLKYCFYSSSLCCNNIINGINARNRITNKEIEEVKKYDINTKGICNETELKEYIDETLVPKNMTYEEYIEKLKLEIENKYGSFWENNNSAANDKYTNRTEKFTINIVEMSGDMKEDDKNNKEASEVKEEDKKNEEALKVKKAIDKNSLEYIEKNILQYRKRKSSKILEDNLKNDNFKLKIDVGEKDYKINDLNKEIEIKINKEICLNKMNEKEICLNKMKEDLEKQLNKFNSLFEKATSSSNIVVEYKDVLNFKKDFTIKEFTTFKNDFNSEKDFKLFNIK